jgi:hypothetical protein
MLDVLVLLADVTDCRFEATREPVFGCFKFDPSILELIATFVILVRVSIRSILPRKILTKDCQLSSMIRLLMLISFFARDSNASKSFCSVRCCPIPFHVQYESPSSMMVD